MARAENTNIEYRAAAQYLCRLYSLSAWGKPYGSKQYYPSGRRINQARSAGLPAWMQKGLLLADSDQLILKLPHFFNHSLAMGLAG